MELKVKGRKRGFFYLRSGLGARSRDPPRCPLPRAGSGFAFILFLRFWRQFMCGLPLWAYFFAFSAIS